MTSQGQVPSVGTRGVLARKGEAAPAVKGASCDRTRFASLIDLRTAIHSAATTEEFTEAEAPCAPTADRSGPPASDGAAGPAVADADPTRRPRVAVTVRLEQEPNSRLRTFASHAGRTLQDVVHAAVDQYLSTNHAETPADTRPCLSRLWTARDDRPASVPLDG